MTAKLQNIGVPCNLQPTLEEKKEIARQNKFAQSCLNAYVKDKNRKALKERQRLEKEAAKAEKLAAKQKHQKSVAPVADVTTEIKAAKKKILFGKHKGQKLKDIPDEYLRWLLENVTPLTFAPYIKERLGLNIP